MSGVALAPPRSPGAWHKYACCCGMLGGSRVVGELLFTPLHAAAAIP